MAAVAEATKRTGRRAPPPEPTPQRQERKRVQLTAHTARALNVCCRFSGLLPTKRAECHVTKGTKNIY